MIAVVPVLYEIMPDGCSRVWLCKPDATVGSTYGENPKGSTRSVPAFPPRTYSPSRSCSCLPDDVQAQATHFTKHRTLGELHDASPGGSIDNAGIFNAKFAEAMEFAL